jgi:hypothetical protein
MALPRGSDYNQAIQAPNISFTDAELKVSRPEVDNWGLPKPYSGGFTTTYKLQNNGHDWAVRCFTREIQDLKVRYETINKFFLQTRSKYFVDATFLPGGIRISGTLYPIIKMKWLNGEPLNIFLSKHYTSKSIVELLILDFLNLVRELESNKIAHGDLQHGNILVKTNQLFLIDYDGMFFPELRGLTTNEIGHVNYQHPSRSANHFNKDIDRFASIVIYTALKTISLNPTIWKKYDNGENMLFKQSDFSDLSSSPLVHDLLSLPEVKPLMERLVAICHLEFDKIPSLNSFINGTFSYTPITLKSSQPISISRSQYLVIDGGQKGSILERMGERVEVVGKVTALKQSLTKRGEPYAMLNMGGRYPIHSFTIVLWAETISALKSIGVSPSDYQNQWISVIGVISQYGGRPQLYIEQRTQIRILRDIQEAQMLLIQKPVQPTVPKKPMGVTTTSNVPKSIQQKTGIPEIDVFTELYGKSPVPQSSNRSQHKRQSQPTPNYSTPTGQTQPPRTSDNKGCVILVIFTALGGVIGGLIAENAGGVIVGAFVGMIASSLIIKS